jgi:hypothetical protein
MEMEKLEEQEFIQRNHLNLNRRLGILKIQLVKDYFILQIKIKMKDLEQPHLIKRLFVKVKQNKIK